MEQLKFDDIINQIKSNKLDKINCGKFIGGNLGNLNKLCNALKSNISIREIYLYTCNLAIIDIKYISDMLKENTYIKKINLNYNHIDDKGAKYIAETLKVNSTLTRLDLGYNDISDEGIKYIGDALKKNKSLIELILSYNNISVIGVKYIIDALRENSKLDRLWIYCGTVTEELNIVWNTLKYNSSMTDVGSSFNEINIAICQRNKYNKYQKEVTLRCTVELAD